MEYGQTEPCGSFEICMSQWMLGDDGKPTLWIG